MATRTLPLSAGKHDMLVPSTSYADQSCGRRISGKPRIGHGWRSQVQGMGIRAQVLRDRRSASGLHDQLDGVGRKFFLPSFLVKQSYTIFSS